MSKTLPFAQNWSQQTVGVKKPSVSDWDWPEECLLPRLICSYQDLTLASDELGDFVVRAGAGAGGKPGRRMRRGGKKRKVKCAFLPCKLSHTCVSFCCVQFTVCLSGIFTTRRRTLL